MYITYLTIYSGTLLPPFYIGSTSMKKYLEGYTGSVTSKKYRKIYEEEKKLHPELFDTIILTEHKIRIDATIQELKYQIEKNTVKSPLFFNESLAKPNGFFGRDTSGKNNPMFGKSNKGIIQPEGFGKGERNSMFGKTHSEISNEKNRNSHLGKKHSKGTIQMFSEMRTGEDNPMFGKYHKDESKLKIGEAQKGNSNYSKPIIIDGILYPSKNNARITLNIDLRWLVTKNPKRVSHIIQKTSLNLQKDKNI